MTRHVVFLVVGAALVALGVSQMLGGGCSLPDFPGSFHVGGSTWENGVELPHRATLKYSSAEKPGRFALSLDAATITVEGDPAVTGLEAEFEVQEKTPGDASLVAAPDSVGVKSASGSPVHVVSAKVRVPPATAVDVATDFGSVTVRGVHGAASVSARTSSGRVELGDLADVARVTGASSFGSVKFEKGSAVADVTLTTDSGAVSASGLSGAVNVTLRSDFGKVSATSVAASKSLSLETDSGSVDVQDVQTATAKLRSDFGAITAKRSTFGHIEAHTSSGSVRLTSCTYQTKDLGTDFGKVVEDK